MGRGREPERMCIVCRRKAGQSAFVRIATARSEASAPLLIDARPRSLGRGAYICRRAECWSSDILVRGLERALRASFGQLELTQIEEFARAFAAEAVRGESA